MIEKWVDKPWGKVWHRLNDEITNESLLEVNANHQCSIHHHTNKYNAFICVDAIIVVEDMGPATESPKLINSIMVNPGTSYIIPPNTWHRFYVIKSGRAIEVYWTTNGQKCDIDDIVRIDTGGKRY